MFNEPFGIEGTLQHPVIKFALAAHQPQHIEIPALCGGQQDGVLLRLPRIWDIWGEAKMALVTKIEVDIPKVLQFLELNYLLLLDPEQFGVPPVPQGKPGPFPFIAQYLLKNSAVSFCRL